MLRNHAQSYEKEITSGFQRGDGTVASLKVNDNSAPRFYKPRPLPCAYRGKVEQERTQAAGREGTIKPIRFSNCAAPTVPVSKSDGSVRICGDNCLTVSQVSESFTKRKRHIYKVRRRSKFTKLDLSNSYQQIKLDAQSRQYKVINRHLGRFKYNRMHSVCLHQQ